MGKIQQALQKLNKGPSALAERAATQHAGGNAEPDGRSDMKLSSLREISLSDEALREAGLLPPAEAKELIAEQFRAVKRPLIDNAFAELDEDNVAPNVLMVTSSQQGEGKTFCTFNLAISIARERDLPVFVIDGDVLSPKMSHALGVEDQPGLIDYLDNHELALEDLTYNLTDLGVTFLPAGRLNSHAHELLASRKMEKFVRDLAAKTSGIVILDSPPVLGANEARVLARNVGQILLVMAAGITPQTTVIEAVGLLDSERPLNVLLNKQSGRPTRYTMYGSYGRK